MCNDKSNDSARDLQTPGDELMRHDLSVHFLRHPCQLEVFQAQEEACSNEDERAKLVYQTWQDLIPAYIKYSNRVDTRTLSRYEAQGVAIARAAAQLRVQA